LRHSFLLPLFASLVLGVACGEDDASAPETKIELRPFTATGQPLTAPERTWTYIEFPDTKCRDGSPAGINVSLNPKSTELMLYLEGGGACFDSFSCIISPGNVSELFRREQTTGIFDRDNPENPVRDWNWVHVPYCTGDTHGGGRENVTIPGVAGTHQFVGYTNIKKFLQRIVPTFPNVTNMLLTGISAGGFGAGQSALLVQSAFPNVKVKLLDDSGPPLSSKVIPTCLQSKWRELWGLDDTYLADCGEACSGREDFVQALTLAMANTFSDRPGGLIESTRDGIITAFFGAGLDNCSGAALSQAVPGDVFAADLADFRKKISKYPQFGTWTPEGTQHTWIAGDLAGNSMYKAKLGDVRLVEWIRRIVAGENPGHYGP
jgi:hypothetical protein